MKKSSIYSFIKYLSSFFIVLLLIFASFAYWAIGKKLPKDSILSIQHPKNIPENVVFKNPLKVVSYNIAHAQGIKHNAWDYRDVEVTKKQLDMLGKALKDMDADVYMLQEVDVDSNRTHRINQIEYLVQEISPSYHYACANMWEHNYIPFPYWPVSHHIGYVNAANCIISKYPISNHHRIIFDKPESNPFWYNWGYIDRGLQRVDVQLGHEKVALINIHMEAWEVNARLKQIKVITDYIKNTELPVILAGDFNTVPLDAPKKNGFLDDIEADYKDEQTFVWFLENSPKDMTIPKFSAHRLNPSDRFSFPSNNPDRLLDHMFIFSSKLSFVDYRVVSEAALASDHLPIMGTINVH